MTGLFRRSIDNKETIMLFYMDSNNKVTQRYVRVLQIEDAHILTYCYYRKNVRVFKLNNILSAGPTNKGVSA